MAAPRCAIRTGPDDLATPLGAPFPLGRPRWHGWLVTDDPSAPGSHSDADAPLPEPATSSFDDVVGPHGAVSHKERPGRRSATRHPLLREAVTVVVSALILSLLIKTFLVQAFYIPSGSMESTLEVGDRVIVSRLVPGPFDLHRGDIVVFKDPGGWLPPVQTAKQNFVARGTTTVLTFVGLLPQDSGEHLIKRVIGMPGDHITCCDAEGRVSINGQPIDEIYINPGSIPSQTPFDVTVPDGMLFVMGDNRQHSQDSRYNTAKPGGGFVPIDNVVGTAFVVVWPVSNLGLLRNPGDVFAGVPNP